MYTTAARTASVNTAVRDCANIENADAGGMKKYVGAHTYPSATDF
jgi:hypothetical protein